MKAYDSFARRTAAYNQRMHVKSVRDALKPHDDDVSPNFRVMFHMDNPDTAKCLAKLYKLGVPGEFVSFFAEAETL